MPPQAWSLLVARLKLRAADARDVPAKLRSAVDDALSTCDGLLLHLGEAEFELERLKRRGTEQALEHDHLFHEMPIACVAIDITGRIVQANAQAAALLNVSARRLPERLLLHFVDQREAFLKLLQELTPNARVHSTLMVRPRERARVEVALHVLPVERGGETVRFCFLTPRTRDGGAPAADVPRPVHAAVAYPAPVLEP